MDIAIDRRIVVTGAVVLFTCFLTELMIAQPSEPSPAALIHRVVQNELNLEHQDNSHWMVQLKTQNKNGQMEVDEVVETNAGDLSRPIEINGHELTAQQRQQSDAQLGRNPAALRKMLKEKNEDAVKSQEMLRILPNAFIFTYGEHRGDLTQLLFKPNPKFHPSSHEAEVFHAMEGNVWVDEKQNRLAEMSGHLIERVNFGGGFLGHLDKGGTFDVQQQEVAPGYWELTVLNVQMNGKALFFKTIRVRQAYSRSDFKRVPDDLTIQKGVQMLKEQATHQGSQS